MKKHPNKKKILGILFLIFVTVLLFVELGMYLSCYYFSNKVSQNEDQLCRIMLFGSSENPEGNTVSAKISMLDKHGIEIATIERSWPDPYLAIDFREADFVNKKYFFPEFIYGVSTVGYGNKILPAKSGSRLERYYIENFNCLLGATKFQRKAFYYIHAFALNKNTVNLSECENGMYYGIFNQNGKLVLRQE